MSLGLYLTATRTGRGDPSNPHVLKWARNLLDERNISEGVDGEGRPAVFCRFHPAAEPVEFIDLGAGRILVSANTSTVGPGYHAHVVDLLDQLSREATLAWDPSAPGADYGDETGYFGTRDFAELQHQMLLWLRALAEHCSGATDGLQVALPLTHRFMAPGFATTPMGIRDRDWFQRVSEDPRGGIDFFAWWERGATAQHHLGRAVSQMWTEVRWRPPYSDAEFGLMENILEALEKAFTLEPSAAYPWAEWNELIELVEWQSPLVEMVHHRAERSGPSTIGYRRFPVSVSLAAGWSIQLDGSMSEDWDEKGTFCATSGGRTIWFTAYRLPARTLNMSPKQILDETPAKTGERLERQEEALLSRGVLTRSVEDGEEFWLFSTDSVAPPKRAVCTICYHDDNDRDWAIETWRSLSVTR